MLNKKCRKIIFTRGFAAFFAKKERKGDCHVIREKDAAE